MKIWCDGAGWNGYTSGYAIVTEDGKINKKVWLEEKHTNNEMEYIAIIEALKIAKHGDEILTDSRLIVEHFNGNFRIKAQNLRGYYEEVRRFCISKNIYIKWVSRKENIAGQLLERG